MKMSRCTPSNSMKTLAGLFQSGCRFFCAPSIIVCLFIISIAPLHAKDSVQILARAGGTAEGMEEDMDELRGIMKERSRQPKFSETPTLSIAQQFGLGYLPLMLVRQHKLIEKHAKKLGLNPVAVKWGRYSSGAEMNKALQTGLLDLATGGVAPLLTAWNRDNSIKGLAALSSMPLYLNTATPGITSINGLSDQDRIALPATQVSTQAVVLHGALLKKHGVSGHARLDAITVSMRHPDAMTALLEGKGGITAHFAAPPFQTQELENPRIRKILDSYEVLNGPATFTTIWTKEGFYQQNPITMKAVLAALREAVEMIRNDKRLAAEIYLMHNPYSALSEKELEHLLSDQLLRFTLEPQNIVGYGEIMHQLGRIQKMPDGWEELYLFPLSILGDRP